MPTVTFSQLPQKLLSIDNVARIRLSDRGQQISFVFGPELEEPVFLRGEDRNGAPLREGVPLDLDLSRDNRTRRDFHRRYSTSSALLRALPHHEFMPLRYRHTVQNIEPLLPPRRLEPLLRPQNALDRDLLLPLPLLVPSDRVPHRHRKVIGHDPERRLLR